ARECLYAGIRAAKAGDRLQRISRAVYDHARKENYGIVHQYCGHGVGFDIHEDPVVMNIPRGANPRLSAGMVLAIEPMVNLGTADTRGPFADGWTVYTADGQPSAHFEQTVAITEDGPLVLTAE
ncbi:MAG: M24 family metallopeptidase, partial [Coriobacteriales bacterium]|nr:M24 family metallopeptidase [Coriobacteriales bacterium]